MLNNKFFLQICFLFCFLLLPFFSLAQTTSLDDSVNQKLKALFQPALQLNDSDVQLLRRFDNTTLIKFVTTVQQLILNKNFGQGINATSNSYTQTIYSNSYSTKTPYCNQQTNIKNHSFHYKCFNLESQNPKPAA